jgi:hypothetical protein
MAEEFHYPVFYVNGSLYAAGGDDANCTLSVCPIEASVYGYRASLPFSSLVIALYALCLITQVAMGYIYKTWGFMAAMILGCITEIIGYAGRILMYNNPWNSAGFIIQIGQLCHPTHPKTTPLTPSSPHHHRPRLLVRGDLRSAFTNVRPHFPSHYLPS